MSCLFCGLGKDPVHIPPDACRYRKKEIGKHKPDNSIEQGNLAAVLKEKMTVIPDLEAEPQVYDKAGEQFQYENETSAEKGPATVRERKVGQIKEKEHGKTAAYRHGNMSESPVSNFHQGVEQKPEGKRNCRSHHFRKRKIVLRLVLLRKYTHAFHRLLQKYNHYSLKLSVKIEKVWIISCFFQGKKVQ